MANYDNLKSALDAVIKTNIVRAITGDLLNGQLDNLIDALGTGYQYMGLATPSTNPGTPDARVAYLASAPGTYQYFGGLTLASGKMGFFRYDGTWHKDEISVQAETTAVVSITSPQDGSIVFSFSNGDEVTVDLNHSHPQYYDKAIVTAMPSGGFLPDVVYNLGTVTGTVTFSLAATVPGNANHYFWMFDTSSTAPTVTFPSGITWADGTGPTVAASKHYEISVLGGIATYLEV